MDIVVNCSSFSLILIGILPDPEYFWEWTHRWISVGHVVPYVLSVVSEFDGLAVRSRWATRVRACTYLCIWLVGHCTYCTSFCLILTDILPDPESFWERTHGYIFLNTSYRTYSPLPPSLTDLPPDPDKLRGLAHVRIYVFD